MKSLPRPRSLTSALKPESFDVNNPEHVTTLLSMGITINVVDKEKVQLVHNSGWFKTFLRLKKLFICSVHTVNV